MKHNILKYKTMRFVLIITVIGTFLFSACQPNKQAQLDKLIKQRDKLTEKIDNLKTELEEGKEERVEKPKLVKIESVKTDDFKHFIEVQGTVESDNNIFVPAQSFGLVTKIYVKEGDAVTKGQLMAETDGSILEKSIEQLNNAYKLTKDVYERQSRLWDQKIGSEIQYLQAKNNKENLEKQLEALREQYKLTRLYSPINGTVDNVMLKVGESATMGGIRVIQLSKLKITAPVSEKYITDISKGDSVLLNFSTIGLNFNATIGSVSKFIDAGNRTFKIEIGIPDDKEDIMPNMIGVIKINDYSSNNVVVLPTNIVQKNEYEHFIFVAVSKDEKMYAEKRIVETGMEYNNKTEILNGLKENEKIITVGYQGLSDGKLIQL